MDLEYINLQSPFLLFDVFGYFKTLKPFPIQTDQILLFIFKQLIGFVIKFKMRNQIFEIKRSNSRSEGEENDLVQGNSGKKFNQLLFCRPYPFQTSIYYRILVIALYFVFLISVLFTFKILVGDSMFLGMSVQTLRFNINRQNIICFGVNAIIKLAIISNIAIQIILGNHKQRFKILFTTNYKLKKFLRLLIEVDTQLSSLLILTQSFPSIINLLFSIPILLFSLVFLQNYCELKDRFYIGNFYYLLIFRLILMIGVLSNVLALFASNTVLFYVIYQISASILMIVLYLLNGWTIYKDTLLRWGLLTFISLYFTISINLLVYMYCVPQNGSFVLHIILTFITVEASLYFRLKSQQINSIKPHSNLQQKCFTIFNYLQDSYFQLQQKALVSSLLKFHSVSNCSNPKCYGLLNEVYDSKKFKQCKTNNFIDERASLTKFYIQCEFETYLQCNPRDDKVLISYCELLYWKFRNIGQTIYWLEILKKEIQHLSFGSLIKFNGLVDIVKKDSLAFCDFLYNRNLDIEHLIDAENTYEAITTRINVILRERLLAWRMISKQQIDLSLVRQKIEPTFTKIVQISQYWKQISKYLNHCSRWKQQYLFFILFIKNEKMKNKVLQQFELIGQKNIDLRLYIKGNNHFELKSLFSQDTCCINVYLSDSKALVKRVSNNFDKFTGYSSVEMLNADINILLPNSSALHHQKIIQSMYKMGKFLDQTIYNLNQVYMVNKSGFLIPVVKIFKEFVNFNGQIEYVCFFKKMQIKQISILCNQYFQIQNFTYNFIEELGISQVDSQNFKGINLISMIPSLTSKSIFSSSNQQVNEKRLKSFEIQAQIQYPKDNFSTFFAFYQSSKKQINQLNLQDYLNLIKFLQIEISKDSIKLEINIRINQTENSQCKYYEVKINQSQLRKQLNNSNSGKESLYKFGLASTTSSSKNIKNQLIRNDKIKQDGTQPTYSNIFIKQEDNQAPHASIYLKSLRYVWLILLISLAVVSNTNLILLSSKYVQIQQFSVNIQSVLQVNSLSSNILAYYQSYLLNATTFAYIKPKIKSFTTSLQTAFKKKNFQQLIFNKDINTPQVYSPITSSLSNGNFSYNQIDFIFFIQSLFHSLAIETNLTTNTYNYNLLINYYYPSFVVLANNTKANLHERFQDCIEEIQSSSSIIYSVSSLLFLAIILSSILLSVKFFRSMFQMMKIHCQFSPQDIKKIIKYYKKTLIMFSRIQNALNTSPIEFQNSNLSNLASQIRQRQQYRQNNNLNKKSKDIIIGKKQINQYIVYVVKVSLCISLLMAFSFWSIYYLSSLVQPIVNVQTYGYKEFLYSPNRITTSLIISNQHMYPYEFAPKQNYKEIMSNSFIQTNIPYIAYPLLDTKFYTYVQNVYFTNLCKLFEDSLKINKFSVSECSTIAKSSFTRGTIAYSGYQYDQIDAIFTYNQTLTAKQIKEFYRSMQFSRLFFSNLVTIWQTQINDMCEWSLFVLKIMIVVINIIIVVVMIFSFVSLFTYLEKQYKFYKQFYRNMMPEFIISEEKIIKSKLVVISFL